MAKKVQLKNNKTGEIIYPVSSAENVYRSNGEKTVEETLIELENKPIDSGGFIISDTEPLDHNKLWINPNDTSSEKEVLLNQDNSVKHNNIADGAVKHNNIADKTIYGTKLKPAGIELGGVLAEPKGPQDVFSLKADSQGKLYFGTLHEYSRNWKVKLSNSNYKISLPEDCWIIVCWSMYPNQQSYGAVNFNILKNGTIFSRTTEDSRALSYGQAGASVCCPIYGKKNDSIEVRISTSNTDSDMYLKIYSSCPLQWQLEER